MVVPFDSLISNVCELHWLPSLPTCGVSLHFSQPDGCNSIAPWITPCALHDHPSICYFFTSFLTPSRFLCVSVQFSSVAQSYLTLCDPMNRSTPGLPVHHQLPEFTQTHIHRVSDAIQPSHPLSSPSPLAPNPSQHQSLFQWVNSSHEVAKVLEFQL